MSRKHTKLERNVKKTEKEMSLEHEYETGSGK